MTTSCQMLLLKIWRRPGNLYHCIYKQASQRFTSKSSALNIQDVNIAHADNKISLYENQVLVEDVTQAPPTFRYVYPEFLPDPKVEWRNKMREKLERIDMINRRSIFEIPEFYAGSIMAVTVSDPHSPGKVNRFVGICIQRGGCGLRASFILRNVVENQGVEILYEMYNPTIQKIEVLRLEKRLDEQLLYLRDSLPEYSTFPFNMEAELHLEGAAVPVNTTKVKLKPRPWVERWERRNLQGVQDLGLSERFYVRAEEVAKPYEKWDLMKQYRATVPEEQQNEIYTEVHSQLRLLEIARRKATRKRIFTKPKKTV